jgi:[protein-PII] uridylyltransferase
VDIQTPDRLGLLYDLLRAMGEAGVIIELSRITTEMDVAMDSFYITGKDGKKITDPPAIKRLQRLLQRAAVRVVE